MKQEDVIKKYEEVLKEYADPKSWVRGIVYNRSGRYVKYGFEPAEKVLKEVEQTIIEETDKY